MSIESVVIVGAGGTPGLIDALTEAAIPVQCCRSHEVPECDLALAFGGGELLEARAAIAFIERQVNGGAIVAYSGPVPVASIASALRRPAQFVGLSWNGHTLEITPTDLTAPGVVAALRSLAVGLGREPIEHEEQLVVSETA